MKLPKYLLLALGLGLAVSSQAQETDFNLSGVAGDAKDYLPASGDIALGTRWSTLVFAITNPFRKDSEDNAINPYEIFGKYYINENFAARASVLIHRDASYQDYRTIQTNFVQETDYVMDRSEIMNRATLIRAGAEMRRGSGRMQGFYGAELVFGFGRSYQRYTYGNALTPDNPAVLSYNFEAAADASNNLLSDRLLGVDETGMRTIGMRLFGGVEIFVAKKFSIAGEVGFGIYNVSTGTKTEFRERMNNGSLEVYQVDARLNNNRTLLQTEIFGGDKAPGANLRAIFHF
jgi:hypothetical protein